MLILAWSQRKKLQDLRESKISDWIVQSDPLSCSIDPVITWIGHASFLIQIGGMNILTDPIFGNTSALYPRIFEPGIALGKMPHIDYVLISHNHRDHMDRDSLLFLGNKHKKTYFLVPEGDKAWFDRRGFGYTKEHTWWEQTTFSLKYDESKEIRFTFLPALHWSQRGLFDKNRSLWGSWMIECNGKKIYFAGDTSYWSHFKEISDEFGTVDTALLPIGPCEPRKWVKHSHLDADEAGKAFLDLKATHFVPMHWGTFPIGLDVFDTPVTLLQKWWITHKDELTEKSLHMPKIGQPIKFDFSS